MLGKLYTDNGRECLKCGNGIHGYNVEKTDNVTRQTYAADVFCYTCHDTTRVYFEREPDDAADMALIHRTVAASAIDPRKPRPSNWQIFA